MDVASIDSARLELVSMSAEFMRASLDGDLTTAASLVQATLPADWPDAAASTLRRRLRQLVSDPTERPTTANHSLRTSRTRS